MKAIILAAGRGSRMCDLTRNVPKCLVSLRGRTLLDLQRSALAGAGIDSVGLVRGYRGEAFEGLGLHLFDNPEWSTTSMVNSLQCAASWLQSEPCIVSYSDIFYSAETVRVLAEARQSIAVAYDPNWLNLWSRRFQEPLLDAESFRQDKGRLVDIGRKVTSLAEIKGQYMGLLRFTPHGFTAVTDLLSSVEASRLDMTSLLRRLLEVGVSIGAVAAVGSWGEVDSASDLETYNQMIDEGVMAFPP